MTSFWVGVIGALIFNLHFYQLGSIFKKVFRFDKPAYEGILFIAFGMILFVFYILIIGSFRLFNPLMILVFMAFVFFIRLSLIRSWLQWLREMAAHLRFSATLRFFLTSLLFASFVLTFLCCFSPETGNDALCYQLNVPKYFVWEKSITPVPFDMNSYMPMSMNCLYAVGLLFKSVMLAKYFHWLAGVLTSLLIVSVLRNYAVSSIISLSTAAAFFLMPTVANEVTTTYVDVATSFYALLAVVLMLEGAQRLMTRYFFLSGLAMGMTIGIKFSLLILLVPVFFCSIYLWHEYRLSWRYFKFGGVFIFGACLVCCYWFIRNYLLVQNPFFPYFGEFWKTIGMKNYSSYLDLGIPKNLWNFLCLPWHLTFNFDVFGRGHWLGPLTFLGVPTLIFAIVKRKGIPFFIFALAGTIVWFLTTQASRYLLPVLPAWHIVGGLGAQEITFIIQSQKWLRKSITGLFLGCLFFLFGVMTYHFRYDFLFLSGHWSADQYLSKLERSWPAARWINMHLPQNAKIFNVEEIRQFYFDRVMVREKSFNFFTSYGTDRSDIQIWNYLKENGFTHILIAQEKDIKSSKPVEDQPRLRKIDHIIQNSSLVRFIIKITSKNIRDPQYEYKLYEIL